MPDPTPCPKCNCCGYPLRSEDEQQMGLCERCAVETVPIEQVRSELTEFGIDCKPAIARVLKAVHKQPPTPPAAVDLDEIRAVLTPFAAYWDYRVSETAPKDVTVLEATPIAYRGRYEGPLGKDCRRAAALLARLATNPPTTA